MVLDYGTLMSDTAVGVKQHAIVAVDSTSDIDLTLRLSDGINIYLDNGMNFSLTADGQPMAGVLHGKTGSNDIVIEGALNGNPKEGPFSGVGRLLVSYPWFF